MKYLIFMLLLLMGCGPDVILTSDGPTATAACEKACQKKYQAHCNSIGYLSGSYYCN